MKITLIAGSNRPDASTTQLSQYIAHLLQEHGHEAEVFTIIRTG